MQFIPLEFEGCYKIIPNVFCDERGEFIKTFNSNTFKEYGLNDLWYEAYYSISQKDIIRGMHFQLPPHDQEKLVYCVNGSALDVLVDLRTNSTTYKQAISIHLSDKNKFIVYIPKGIAHGFKSLENNTIMQYNTSTIYNSSSDYGILWNSCPVDWDLSQSPIISNRDKSFPSLNDFKSPF